MINSSTWEWHLVPLAEKKTQKTEGQHNSIETIELSASLQPLEILEKKVETQVPAQTLVPRFITL